MTLHFISDLDEIGYLASAERVVRFALLVSLRVCEGAKKIEMSLSFSLSRSEKGLACSGIFTAVSK